MLIDKTQHTTPYYIYSLSQYSKLIQEYQEDKDGTHKLDQEKVDIENLSLQGAPVGEFILHHLLRYIPSQEETGKKTCRRKANQSNKVLPPNDSLSVAPKESEQNAPMMAQATVTIMAPFFLSIFNSS